MLKIESLSFDDVLLRPQYSGIISRQEINISSALDGVKDLTCPIISSPMDTVTESRMAIAMDQAGAMGIIHRYNTIEEQTSLIKSAVEEGCERNAAAIGVSGDYIQRAEACYEAGVNLLCIDIAHGHHLLMKKALEELRLNLPPDLHIMAGNVATLDGYEDLVEWGANSVRVGIGGGSICSTRIQTGHGVPTLQSVLDCSQSNLTTSHPIIADGGIKSSGDIVKALAAGADFVMLGSLLAGTDETPGDITYVDGIPFKSYRGMASVEAQIDWRGHASSVEGVSTAIPVKGPLEFNMGLLIKGVKSGLSYSGCRNLSVFRAKAEFLKQTNNGRMESGTHINSYK